MVDVSSAEGTMGGSKYIDAESDYRGNKEDDRTIRAIVMDHLRRITTVGSQEMRGGYWREKEAAAANGIKQTISVYVPDTREEYCNSIKMLYLFVVNEAEGMFKFQEVLAEINKRVEVIEKAKAEFLSKIKMTEVLSMDMYKGHESELSAEEYKQLRVKLHDDLLKEVMRFVKEIGYFQKASRIDYTVRTTKDSTETTTDPSNDTKGVVQEENRYTPEQIKQLEEAWKV
jgi:hypothetical protein